VKRKKERKEKTPKNTSQETQETPSIWLTNSNHANNIDAILSI
jgi:hypothetical protein